MGRERNTHKRHCPEKQTRTGTAGLVILKDYSLARGTWVPQGGLSEHRPARMPKFIFAPARVRA